MSSVRHASVALLAVLLTAAAGCSGSRADRVAGTGGPPRVRRGAFVSRFLLTGVLESSRAEKLTVPRVPGGQSAIRWLADDGTAVSAGDVVVRFDEAAFGRNLEEKKLQREQAGADLARREAEIDAGVAEKEFAVEQRRLALEKADAAAEVPKELRPLREWQELQLARDRARIEHKKAIEDLEATRVSGREELEQKRIALGKTEREIAVAEEALSSMSLKAPFDGLFLHGEHPWEGRKIQVGDAVWSGFPVAEMPDLTSMRVAFKLSDVDDRRVVPGMKAACTIDAYPDRAYEGRVTEIAAFAQEMERFSTRRGFPGRIELDATDPDRMRPGMSVRCEVETLRRDDVLLAPRVGLDLGADPPTARAEGGGAVPVTLGPCNPLECVVERGLAEGDALEPVR